MTLEFSDGTNMYIQVEEKIFHITRLGLKGCVMDTLTVYENELKISRFLSRRLSLITFSLEEGETFSSKSVIIERLS